MQNLKSNHEGLKLIMNFYRVNVSRLESGKIQIDKTRFDMAVLVKESEE